MSRYWVFHDRRLRGPLEPQSLRELEGFTLDMRVCPEGGPETDWRPAREHGEIAALFGAAARPVATQEPPSIPRLTTASGSLPSQPPSGEALAAGDLSRRLTELERAVAQLKALCEDLRQGRASADREVSELASAVASAVEQLSEVKKAAAMPPPFIAPAPEPAPEPASIEAPPPPPPPPPPEPEIPALKPLARGAATRPEDATMILPPPPFSAVEHASAAPASEPAAPAFDPDATTILPPPPFSELAHAPETLSTDSARTESVDKPAEPLAGVTRDVPPPPFNPDATMVLPPSAPAGQTAAAGFRKLRILSADDDELMRQSIAAAFKREGHDVDSADDGKKALELIAANPYDLVILDEGMPGGNGFQVARAISQAPADSRPKVLIFTAQYVGNKLARETFLMSGADDVLSKEAGMTGLLKKACELTGLALPS